MSHLPHLKRMATSYQSDESSGSHAQIPTCKQAHLVCRSVHQQPCAVRHTIHSTVAKGLTGSLRISQLLRRSSGTHGLKAIQSFTFGNPNKAVPIPPLSGQSGFNCPGQACVQSNRPRTTEAIGSCVQSNAGRPEAPFWQHWKSSLLDHYNRITAICRNFRERKEKKKGPWCLLGETFGPEAGGNAGRTAPSHPNNQNCAVCEKLVQLWNNCRVFGC